MTDLVINQVEIKPNQVWRLKTGEIVLIVKDFLSMQIVYYNYLNSEIRLMENFHALKEYLGDLQPESFAFFLTTNLKDKNVEARN